MGKSDGLTDPKILVGLIRVAQPEYKEPPASSFPQNTSEYRACKLSHSTYLPFNDSAFVEGFDIQVKQNYGQAVDAMVEFINAYIDVGNEIKIKRLVKALLEVIDEDEHIPSNENLFYTNERQPAVSKSALRSVTEIQLQSFLLGVWHYIITNVPDNTAGEDTFKAWHKEPEIKGQQWDFVSKIGEGITRDIAVSYVSATAEASPDETIATDEPTIEYEEPTAEPFPIAPTQFINKQFNIQQSGNGNTQVGNVETLTINIG
jgi:hypothetical protein